MQAHAHKPCSRPTLLPALLASLCIASTPHAADPARKAVIFEARILEITQTKKNDRVVGEGSLLAAPRVTTLENRPALVSNGAERAFLSGVHLYENGPIVIEAVPESWFVGTKMEIEGHISADGRVIHGRLKILFRQLLGVETTHATAVVCDGDDVGKVEVRTERPIFKTCEVETVFDIPDGGLLLLGGRLFNYTYNGDLSEQRRENVHVMMRAKILDFERK